MTLEKALLVLAELREHYIASTIQPNYCRQQIEAERVVSERVQALDVVIKELERK